MRRTVCEQLTYADECERSFKERFPGFVLELLKERGYSRTYLSQISGVDARTIRRTLSGETVPDLSTVVRLIAALDGEDKFGKFVVTVMCDIGDSMNLC